MLLLNMILLHKDTKSYTNIFKTKFFCKISYGLVHKKNPSFNNKKNQIHFTFFPYKINLKNHLNIMNSYNLKSHELIKFKFFRPNKAKRKWNNVHKWLFKRRTIYYPNSYKFNYSFYDKKQIFVNHKNFTYSIKHKNFILTRDFFFKSNFMKTPPKIKKHFLKLKRNLKKIRKISIYKFYNKYTLIPLIKKYNNYFLSL